MRQKKANCCIHKLFSRIDKCGAHLISHLCSCQTRNQHKREGTFITSNYDEDADCRELPVVHLDNVKGWNSNSESFYVLGEKAWLCVKPFLSFFTSDFSVKLGTCSPSVLRSPSMTKTLVWHAAEGFPHEERGTSFSVTNKVWLNLPTKSYATFQSFVLESLGLHIFKTMCVPCFGHASTVMSNVVGKRSTPQLMFGVESEEAAARFFAGLTAYSDEDCAQYLPPNADTSEPESYSVTPFGNNQEPGNSYENALPLSTGEVVEEELLFHQIKSEIKCEQPEVILPDDSVQEPVKKKSHPIVKCPGCVAVYPDNRSGLDALGHHIINSHKRYAVHYRRRLRARLLAER